MPPSLAVLCWWRGSYWAQLDCCPPTLAIPATGPLSPQHTSLHSGMLSNEMLSNKMLLTHAGSRVGKAAWKE